MILNYKQEPLWKKIFLIGVGLYFLFCIPINGLAWDNHTWEQGVPMSAEDEAELRASVIRAYEENYKLWEITLLEQDLAERYGYPSLEALKEAVNAGGAWTFYDYDVNLYDGYARKKCRNVGIYVSTY